MDDMKNVDDICNEIKDFSKYQYAKGVCDVLNLLNEKYIIKVWDKKDAEKFFDDVLDTLRDLHPLVVPHLPFNACYGWSGGSCPNEHQRKFLAETYCIYREIIHRLTVENHKDEDRFWNVYLGETLTCEEGGELPIIEKL